MVHDGTGRVRSVEVRAAETRGPGAAAVDHREWGSGGGVQGWGPGVPGLGSRGWNQGWGPGGKSRLGSRGGSRVGVQGADPGLEQQNKERCGEMVRQRKPRGEGLKAPYLVPPQFNSYTGQALGALMGVWPFQVDQLMRHLLLDV